VIKTIKLHFIILGILGFCSSLSFGQSKNYSVANAHSHNDYENPIPFYTAYNARFGSIEADIFLQKNELIVAHDTVELRKHRTLQQFYLDPLLHFVRQNNGYAYQDTSRRLQMLIDIKTDSINTLNKLIEVLKKYSQLINNRSITWTITGNRPASSLFTSYPSFIGFDGELDKEYSKQTLTKIVMLSGDFRDYSQWNGNNIIPVADSLILQNQVIKAHDVNKPIRFWNAPDNINAWQQFMLLKIDYLNTDHINELANFLNKK
jgi:alkaline phosphatase